MYVRLENTLEQVTLTFKYRKATQNNHKIVYKNSRPEFTSGYKKKLITIKLLSFLTANKVYCALNFSLFLFRLSIVKEHKNNFVYSYESIIGLSFGAFSKEGFLTHKMMRNRNMCDLKHQILCCMQSRQRERIMRSVGRSN